LLQVCPRPLVRAGLLLTNVVTSTKLAALLAPVRAAEAPCRPDWSSGPKSRRSRFSWRPGKLGQQSQEPRANAVAAPPAPPKPQAAAWLQAHGARVLELFKWDRPAWHFGAGPRGSRSPAKSSIPPCSWAVSSFHFSDHGEGREPGFGYRRLVLHAATDPSCATSLTVHPTFFWAEDERRLLTLQSN